MNNKFQIAAAVVLFVFFMAYGMQALTIPLFPGQELEPFKPRTLPVALAVAGLLLCVIRLVQLVRLQTAIDGPDFGSMNWWPVIQLCIGMLMYGFLMLPLGFILATMLFLLAGFLILGERRRAVLLFLPSAFSLGFFLLMTQGLGLYLSTGTWFGG
jgi:putative tricarboxylic transport membrane protein